MRKVFAGVFLALAAPLSPAASPGAVFIEGAHVITGSGADLASASVILRDGLIEDIGPGLAAPADAWVIQGKGLTVYPGFMDGLSTWGIAAAAPPPPQRPGGAAGTPANQPAAPVAQPATPTPRSRGPEDRPQTYAFERAADLLSPADTRLEMARAAGYTSAASFPNRGIVEGLGAMISLAGERGRAMVIAQPVGQQIVLRTAGFRAGFPGSLMGDIAYVRQLYLDLNHYKQAQQIYKQRPVGTPRPEYDHDLEGLAGSPRLLLPADEVQQIDRMLAFGSELGVPFALYGLHEAYLRIDQLKQANAPLLLSLKWPVKPKDGDPTVVPNYRDLRMRDQAPSIPALLAKAGVKFAFFSDGIATAPELKSAVKKAIDAGLPPAQAVRALTLSVAELYGLADRLGSIDKGKIANIIVSKGDIFDEKSNIEYVFVDGKEFRPPEELQKPAARPSAGGSEAKPAMAGAAGESQTVADGDAR
ncbi:MAG TPA: amidohydrolase family protein [Bryobacteraceae bacterium]|nr:amidohydrolase family protein [Bryobacteraceae bacterium]